MRILIVNDYCAEIGGAEILSRTLRDGLRRRGHDARLFTTTADATPGGARPDFTCFGTVSRWRTPLQLANPSAYRRMRWLVSAFRPDVVHLNMHLTQLSPWILPALQQIPTVYYALWYRAVCPLGTRLLPSGAPCASASGSACLRNGCLPVHHWLQLMVQKRLWSSWRHHIDRVVAASEAVRRQLLPAGITPVDVIWHGVPVVNARRRLSPQPTAVFAGRLVREKGADVLIRAFAETRKVVPTARLLIVGDGPERDRIRSLIASLGLYETVEMTPSLPPEELEKRCQRAWIHVMPSRWEEPFGLVAAQAMMRGTAVVASATGGPADFITHGETGLLTPPGDVGELAAGMSALFADRDLCEEYGVAARRFAAKRLNTDVMISSFLDLYHTLNDQTARQWTPQEEYSPRSSSSASMHSTAI